MCEIAEIRRSKQVRCINVNHHTPQYNGLKTAKRRLEPLSDFLWVRFDIRTQMLTMQTVLNINQIDIATSTAGLSRQPSKLLPAICVQAPRLGNVF